MNRIAGPAVLDSGALIAFERGDQAVRSFVRTASIEGIPLIVPTPVIAEVWRGGSGRQANLARFLKSGVAQGYVRIVDLTYPLAQAVGVILARTPMSVTDGFVCLCALRMGGTVLTSDPDDIRKVISAERVHVV